MSCRFSEKQIEQTVSFHGHHCPGLSIGIRAAELAFRELDVHSDMEMIAVAETDMCGVDAIQYLTGCTLGKGNFIHRDIGKMAFSFFNKASGKGIRALLNPDIRSDMDAELGILKRKLKDGTASDTERARHMTLTTQLKKRFMETELHRMFKVSEPNFPMPRPARVLSSLECVSCGERVMESRTRRFDEQTMCIPCFALVEQKL